MSDEPLWQMRSLSRKELAVLRRLAKRNGRYGSSYGACAQLRNLGLVVALDTGRPPPGQWVWTITPAGRAKAEASNAG